MPYLFRSRDSKYVSASIEEREVFMPIDNPKMKVFVGCLIVRLYIEVLGNSWCAISWWP